MTDDELRTLIDPAMHALNCIPYDEAVVIGSVIGQLSDEIKRLRDGQEVKGPLVYPPDIQD